MKKPHLPGASKFLRRLGQRIVFTVVVVALTLWVNAQYDKYFSDPLIHYEFLYDSSLNLNTILTDPTRKKVFETLKISPLVGIGRHDNLALRTFGGPCGKTSENTRLLVDFGGGNKRDVKQHLDHLVPKGKRTLESGVIEATSDLEQLARSNKDDSYVLFMVITGEDECDPQVANERIAQRIQDYSDVLGLKSRVILFPNGVFSNHFSNTVGKAVLETGGQVVDTASAETIARDMQQVQEELEDTTDTYRAQRLATEGTLARWENQFERAEKQYALALEIYTGIPDPRGVASVKLELGHLERQRGNFALSRQYYLAAIKYYKKTRALLWHADAMYGLAILEIASSRTQDAQALLTEAMQVYQQEKNQLGIAKVLIAQGNVHRYRGEMAKAKASYEAGIKIYKTEGEIGGLGDTLELLANIELRQGDIKSALNHYNEMVNIYDAAGLMKKKAAALDYIDRLKAHEY